MNKKIYALGVLVFSLFMLFGLQAVAQAAPANPGESHGPPTYQPLPPAQGNAKNDDCGDQSNYWVGAGHQNLPPDFIWWDCFDPVGGSAGKMVGALGAVQQTGSKVANVTDFQTSTMEAMNAFIVSAIFGLLILMGSALTFVLYTVLDFDLTEKLSTLSAHIESVYKDVFVNDLGLMLFALSLTVATAAFLIFAGKPRGWYEIVFTLVISSVFAYVLANPSQTLLGPNGLYGQTSELAKELVLRTFEKDSIVATDDGIQDNGTAATGTIVQSMQEVFVATPYQIASYGRVIKPGDKCYQAYRDNLRPDSVVASDAEREKTIAAWQKPLDQGARWLGKIPLGEKLGSIRDAILSKTIADDRSADDVRRDNMIAAGCTEEATNDNSLGDLGVIAMFMFSMIGYGFMIVWLALYIFMAQLILIAFTMMTPFAAISFAAPGQMKRFGYNYLSWVLRALGMTFAVLMALGAFVLVGNGIMKYSELPLVGRLCIFMFFCFGSYQLMIRMGEVGNRAGMRGVAAASRLANRDEELRKMYIDPVLQNSGNGPSGMTPRMLQQKGSNAGGGVRPHPGRWQFNQGL